MVGRERGNNMTSQKEITILSKKRSHGRQKKSMETPFRERRQRNCRREFLRGETRRSDAFDNGQRENRSYKNTLGNDRIAVSREKGAKKKDFNQ